MKIETFQFGTIEYKPENLIKFVSGIIGFEQLKEFLLLKSEDDFCYWLNSVKEPDIAFPLIGTKVIDPNYPAEDGYEPFGIITLNPDPARATVNLKAPVMINQDEKNGFQKIIDVEKYSINYSLFKE